MKRKIIFLMLFMGLFALSFAQQYRNFIPSDERDGTVLMNSAKSTIEASSIKWWIGSGSHSAILIVNWCNPEVALAWGFRWDGSQITVEDMLNSITAADSRFSYNASSGFLNDLLFQNSEYNLSSEGMYWLYNVNGSLAGGGFNAQILSDGDVIEWGDEACLQDWGVWDIPTVAVTNPALLPIPDDVTIHEDSVKYWIGNGNNQIVFAVNWCDPERAFAWGYRFSTDSVLVSSIMDSIVAKDSRFNYTLGSYGIEDILYQDSLYSLSVTASGYMMYNINGTLAPAGHDAQYVKNGDFIKWGDVDCAHQDEDWNTSWTTLILPVSIPAPVAIPEDVTISANEILYWLGSGNNQIVFAVNWCNPELALAWGYRFASDSMLVSAIMDSIQMVDSRFSYTIGQYGVGDILYQDDTLSLSVNVSSYMMYNINGSLAQAGYNAQYVKNGDFIKWGDAACSHQDENWNMSWTTPIIPVSIPTGVGIKSYDSEISFRVVPNPASYSTTLHVEGMEGVANLSIYDQNGRMLFTEMLSVTPPFNRDINLTGFSPGLYFVRIQYGVFTKVRKLIVR